MPDPPKCPHCSRPIRGSNLAQHVSVCPKNPPIHARLAQELRSDVDPTRIVPAHTYMAMSGRMGLPSAGVLKYVYGSWSGVAEAFGLHMRGNTQGKTSSYKVDFDDISRQLDAMRRRAEEARREQERIASTLDCLPGERVVGEWSLRKDEDGRMVGYWKPARVQTVWLVR